MTTFDEREKGFENQFAHDEELKFKATARRDRLLGLWAAEKVGLTGGHIFQGECLPAYMWHKRLTTRTPMRGFYLCGACTHPGGSVIGINGRNAAMAVLKDSKNKESRPTLLSIE